MFGFFNKDKDKDYLLDADIDQYYKDIQQQAAARDIRLQQRYATLQTLANMGTTGGYSNPQGSLLGAALGHAGVGSNPFAGVQTGRQAGVHPAVRAQEDAHENITKVLADMFLDRYPEFEPWAKEELFTLWQSKFGSRYVSEAHKKRISLMSKDELMFASLSYYLLYESTLLIAKIDTAHDGIDVVLVPYGDC